jgi:hypothetical protein
MQEELQGVRISAVDMFVVQRGVTEGGNDDGDRRSHRSE